MSNEERIKQILSILEQTYPDARPALNFDSPYQLLTAVILSAQCTDVKVNKVTPELFLHYPDPAALAAASVSDVEDIIRTCGLFHTKSRNLITMASILTNQYEGSVPDSREALEALPGVGRKTANVVLSCAFGKDAIAVDTHVFRVSNRLGLADASDVLKTEEQLMEHIPRNQWSRAHHWLIYHGRRICHARNPACTDCPLHELCEYANGNAKGKK